MVFIEQIRPPHWVKINSPLVLVFNPLWVLECGMDLKTWADLEYGRRLALAKAIGVPPSFVLKMISGEKKVPFTQCMPIERATGGAVTRRDLMPDTYLIHWPELAEAQANSAQAVTETVATSADALPAILDLPPIVVAPAAPAWDGVDRRDPVSQPPTPELERRALAGGV